MLFYYLEEDSRKHPCRFLFKFDFSIVIDSLLVLVTINVSWRQCGDRHHIQKVLFVYMCIKYCVLFCNVYK